MKLALALAALLLLTPGCFTIMLADTAKDRTTSHREDNPRPGWQYKGTLAANVAPLDSNGGRGLFLLCDSWDGRARVWRAPLAAKGVFERGEEAALPPASTTTLFLHHELYGLGTWAPQAWTEVRDGVRIDAGRSTGEVAPVDTGTLVSAAFVASVPHSAAYHTARVLVYVAVPPSGGRRLVPTKAGTGIRVANEEILTLQLTTGDPGTHTVEDDHTLRSIGCVCAIPFAFVADVALSPFELAAYFLLPFSK